MSEVPSPLSDARSVSFTITTFNSARKIGDCLESIRKQRYPASKVEVVVADGGSTDSTLEICRQHGVTVVHNPVRSEKGFNGGKTLALLHAKNEIVIVLDSDNVLGSDQYIRQITAPFEDPNVVVVSPLITADPTWRPFERYAGIVYDPFDYGWTVAAEERARESARDKEYVTIVCEASEKVYLGNGSAVRREIYTKVGGYDYDLETGKRLYEEGRMVLSIKSVVFHHNAISVRELIRKRVKLVDDLVTLPTRSQVNGFSAVVLPHDRGGLLRLALQVLGNLTVTYPLLVSVRGYRRTRDAAFAWHPFLAPIATLAYGTRFLSCMEGRALVVRLIREGLRG